MAGINESIAEQVGKIIEPVLSEIHVELVDVEYLSERGRWVLRIYVDRAGGITVDDCAWVSREIGDMIDVADVIPHEYVLEVSSPGLNRPLKKEKDFLGALGKKVKVKLAEPREGRRNFTGKLKDVRDGMLFLEVKDDLLPLALQQVEKANLIYEFDRI